MEEKHGKIPCLLIPMSGIIDVANHAPNNFEVNVYASSSEQDEPKGWDFVGSWY